MPSATLRQFLAANVHRHRVHLGWSQEELADRAGLDVRFVRRVESSAGTDVRLSTLLKLAEALDCAPGDLLVPATPVKRRPGRPSTKRASTPTHDK